MLHLGRTNSSLQSFGTSSKHAEIEPYFFEIVACHFVGTAPDILGLVSLALGPNPVRRRRFLAGSWFAGPFCVAAVWLAFIIFNSRFDRWAVLGGSRAANSVHFRPAFGSKHSPWSLEMSVFFLFSA